jgi:hypothetical protein
MHTRKMPSTISEPKVKIISTLEKPELIYSNKVTKKLGEKMS